MLDDAYDSAHWRRQYNDVDYENNTAELRCVILLQGLFGGPGHSFWLCY